MAKLFANALPPDPSRPEATIVDWSFLDTDDGQPGELPDWAKKQIERLERYRDKEGTNEMLDHIIASHKFTRNIPPPSIPKRYDPNEPSFTPPDRVF